MTVVNLLLGGPPTEYPAALKAGHVKGIWLGADRGSLRLLKMGIVPECALGDFDSVNATELKRIKAAVPHVKQFPTHKNDTDTEIVLQEAMKQYHPDKIRIYGATGARLDQFFSNLLMFLEPRFRPIAEKVEIIDRHNRLTFYLPGEHTLSRNNEYHYLSFMPLDAMHITTSGVAYPLTNHWIGYPRSYSSNEITASAAHFKFDRGMLCVIQSHD